MGRAGRERDGRKGSRSGSGRNRCPCGWWPYTYGCLGTLAVSSLRGRCEITRSAALQGCPAAVGRPKGLRYERPPLISQCALRTPSLPFTRLAEGELHVTVPSPFLQESGIGQRWP